MCPLAYMEMGEKEKEINWKWKVLREILEGDKAAASCRGLTRDIWGQPVVVVVDWKRWQMVCNGTQRQWPAYPLPACGSRVVFVHVQLTLERVEGLPACSTRMGEFCACDRRRLVSKIFALLVITMSWGPPAVTQNYSSHAAQNSPHRALATVLPEWAPAHLLFCRTWEQEGVSLHLVLGPSTFVLCINS